jgi:two-component system, OmpR family, sensor histidine kinase VicK
MTTYRAGSDRPWRTAVFGVIGLLVAIAVIGVAGILINGNIRQTVERAIAFDVELEDRGDDLRVAVLDVRHYHRDLLLNNPSVPRIEEWQARYEILLDEIDRLDGLLARSPDDPDLPHVGELRLMAEAYYDEFAETVEDVEDEQEFINRATDLLEPIAAIEEVAEQVDNEGERRAAAAFRAIDDASSTGAVILGSVIVGLGAVGVVLAFAILRLVQEQRRLFTVEQAAVAQMAEASRAKTDFIADASHELRTPLTVLRGNAEVGLAMNAQCEHGEILREIVEESARMSRLVDDLLFLARSDAASVPLELRDVGAREMLDAIAGRAEILARERGARLATAVDCSGQLLADDRRVEQAILILVDNAAKYGPPGGLVELSAWNPDTTLAVEVRDRGPGIPEEQRTRIFERFVRLHRGPRGDASGGVGLGLSIAAAIVEGHGGTITAHPRDGGGTTMRVDLPLRPH